MSEQQSNNVVDRTTPKPQPARAALVDWWQGTVDDAKTLYQERFTEIRRLQRFTRGLQWPGLHYDMDDRQYVVNVTLRHVSQRVAQLYAKNPKAVARLRKRLENTVWNGSPDQVAQAQQTLQLASQAVTALDAANPAAVQAVQAQVQQAQAVLADFQRVTDMQRMRERAGETLELLYDYSVDEQQFPFKTMMKLAVRRALTTGVGWVKIGFQRATQLTLDYQTRIHDITEALALIEQQAADLADGETLPDDKEAERLRLQIQGLQREGQVLVREGLVFDYPGSTSIIPDPNCRNLKTFLGCGWVCQEYLLTPEQIQQIYKIDVGSSFDKYKGRASTAGDGGYVYAGAPPDAGLGHPDDREGKTPEDSLALVREIYCKADGLVYVTCAGFPDFLAEPAPPEVWTERFYPWHAIIFNEVDDDEEGNDVFPPSDVELIEHQQLEINRSREALREHRIANRPAYGTASGMLSEQDKDKLVHRPAHAIVELQGLQPGQSVNELLQAVGAAPLDPALYNVQPQFDDILRAGGLQEANLGGISGGTATESSIAAASLSVTNNSAVDDLDEVLTALARSGGQILLANTSEQTVREIVGEGAVWPTLSKTELARELWLEIEAGSTGRPNQAQEIANAERMFPLLLQIPGISPEWLARELIRRLDDRLDLQSALTAGLPSVVAMNAQQRPATGDAQSDPGSQGPAGALPAGPAPGAGGQPPAGVNVTTPPVSQEFAG